MPRTRNTRNNSNHRQRLPPGDRHEPTGFPLPRFIGLRQTVNYDHLPRPLISSEPDGTLSDRIGWVLLHPDLQDCVRTRTQHIPNAAEHVRLYRDFARIASYQTRVVRYIQENEGPPDEKTSSL